MFIKSKYSKAVVNTDGLLGFGHYEYEDEWKSAIAIEFKHQNQVDSTGILFQYKSNEDRDNDWDFILSQLDCMVNDGKKEPGLPPVG